MADNSSYDELYVPPAFRWTLLPPDHPERMRKVLAYINAGAAVGVGPLEWDTIKAALSNAENNNVKLSYQSRVKAWAVAAFGDKDVENKHMRFVRFMEEAAELVQAGGITESQAHQVVSYVFGRPVGSVDREVGGVMVTLAALCSTTGHSMDEIAEVELARCWEKIIDIRARHASKPSFDQG